MIEMLRDRILVKPQVRSLSDVLIVKNSEKMNQGEVMAVGPLVDELKVGDSIKYGNGTYLDFPFFKGKDGVQYQMMQEADVACVVEH